ncbi:TetR family transcriptional regulator [Nocardia altamirensis]|uniref:TetR family transcriptional regulator n=1 Tax=Nocardia altamirensis TaxID=472158 RepID=UPI0009FFB1A6|nr:TetR family transcriptional regulator [Nocardia altamirensis]
MLESPTPTGASAAAEHPASATPHPGPHPTGLRERKKEQTRLRIIEVGLNLCDAQGFDATTIEQIANAADISPRTINRYFESKEDIVLGPVVDFGAAIAETLRGMPVTGNELESLREAFLQVVDRASADNAAGPVTFRQFQQMRRIMRGSSAVSTRSIDHAETKNAAIAGVLAERLGTKPDAMPVRIVLGVWQLIGHLGMECQQAAFDDDDLEAAAQASRTAFTSTFDEFLRVCCPDRG